MLLIMEMKVKVESKVLFMDSVCPTSNVHVILMQSCRYCQVFYFKSTVIFLYEQFFRYNPSTRALLNQLGGEKVNTEADVDFVKCLRDLKDTNSVSCFLRQ